MRQLQNQHCGIIREEIVNLLADKISNSESAEGVMTEIIVDEQ